MYGLPSRNVCYFSQEKAAVLHLLRAVRPGAEQQPWRRTQRRCTERQPAALRTCEDITIWPVISCTLPSTSPLQKTTSNIQVKTSGMSLKRTESETQGWLFRDLKEEERLVHRSLSDLTHAEVSRRKGSVLKITQWEGISKYGIAFIAGVFYLFKKKNKNWKLFILTKITLEFSSNCININGFWRF